MVVGKQFVMPEPRADLPWSAVKNGDAGRVQMLIEQKAAVNLQDQYGRTPLLVAMANEHVAVIRVLVEAKADVELQDQFGRTPLDAAMK